MAINHQDDYDTADTDVEPVEVDDVDDTIDVDADSVAVDPDGADSSDDASRLTDADLAEAESLTVTAKQSIRQQLEDEVARFLAQGGRITEVPTDDTVRE
ncbi:hypothetical protein RJJ65_35825 [Rhizobium hidalgonense]|uniref:Transcriptional regulator SutA RNAP-binding domain-containing protein n=1 Tax=Rhizobium hidalgonense TaxID=1538159 RepID=A0AAJ2GXZ8_9HYPH|nr:hypothetical protein [Rhizobium hidalgonense]MDR9777905.1 hypothetical protein [Rhizobium hidalgonense]